MRVTDSVGSTVRTVSLGQLATGAHVWNWNGANDSAHVISGTYVVHLDAVGGAPDALTGSAAKTVRVDVVKPTVTSVATTYGSVFPQSDGYRDKTYLSVKVSEVSTVVYRATNSAGAVVWTARIAGQPTTRARVTWKGTKTSGAKLPAGRYVVRATVTDAAGNAVRSTGRVITISWRKTAVRTWIKTVTAEGPSGGGYEATTSASYVARDGGFGSGALRFHASSTARFARSTSSRSRQRWSTGRSRSVRTGGGSAAERAISHCSTMTATSSTVIPKAQRPAITPSRSSRPSPTCSTAIGPAGSSGRRTATPTRSGPTPSPSSYLAFA